ncbi:MAG: site-2 protease family protein [Candidatus Micrarchaeia archaeon]
MKKFLAVLSTALAVFAFHQIVVSPVNGIVKFLLSVLLLFLSGMSLQKLLNLEGEKGLIILKTEKGKKFLDEVARWNLKFWRNIAAFGMVMGFGASSMLLFKNIPEKTFKISILLLMLSVLFILPLVLPTAVDIINLPVKLYFTRAATTQSTLPETLTYYLVFFSIVLGGFCFAGVISFVGYGLVVLFGVVMKFLSMISSMGSAVALRGITPGAMPIIPGVNLPFFEGILSLAVLLFFHEVSHGVLARVEKIRVKNSGLVLFGFLPIGAFVDPDEKQLQSSSKEKQKNVLVAGSSANFILCLIFFLLFIFYQLVIISNNPPPPSFFKEHIMIYEVVPQYPAYGVLKSGMIIMEWNGVEITTLDDFSKASNTTKENDTVTIVTDKGSFSIKAGKEGKVGVRVFSFTNSTTGSWMAELSSQKGKWWVGFLYNFLGLTFVLNFIVGTVNLLPIPPFDGYRIISLVIKNEKMLKAIKYGMVLFFLLNLLPWAWQ